MATREPRADRPYMLGYEMMMGGELIPWAWARERLERPRNYWLATVTPKGKPHMMPVWGVWLDERFYFSTGAKSRKARNLEENPNCVIGTEEDNGRSSSRRRSCGLTRRGWISF